MRHHTRHIAALTAACLLAGGWAVAQEGPGDAELDNLSKQLVAKRKSVDEFASKIAQAKAANAAELQQLRDRRLVLTRQVEQEHKGLEALQADIDTQQAEIERKTQARDALVPLAKRHLAAVRAAIAKTLPFQQAKRLQNLDELQRKLASGKLDAQSVLVQLGGLIDDEFRLSKESGLYQDTITLNGATQLGEIVKLGMVALYFRTSTGQVGLVVPDGSSWTYQVVQDEANRKRLITLFEAFTKRIRTGYFEVPNPVAGR